MKLNELHIWDRKDYSQDIYFTDREHEVSIEVYNTDNIINMCINLNQVKELRKWLQRWERTYAKQPTP